MIEYVLLFVVSTDKNIDTVVMYAFKSSIAQNAATGKATQG